MRAEEEEIDQAVLERRAALLDRLRGKHRIDAIGQRRQQETPAKGPRRSYPKGKKCQSGGETQPLMKDPVVQHSHGQKENERRRCQQHHAGSYFNQADLPAGVFDSLLDELFVSSLRGGIFRLRTSGNRATCHDGSLLSGLLLFLPLIIDGIAGR